MFIKNFWFKEEKQFHKKKMVLIILIIIVIFIVIKALSSFKKDNVNHTINDNVNLIKKMERRNIANIERNINNRSFFVGR